MREESSSGVKVYYPSFNLAELIEKLKHRLTQLSSLLPLEEAILFGSWVEGRATVASDIDLLLIYKDPKRDDAYSICWDVLNIQNLELHLYTRTEYERLKSSGSQLIRRIEEKGIRIWQTSSELSSKTTIA